MEDMIGLCARPENSPKMKADLFSSLIPTRASWVCFSDGNLIHVNHCQLPYTPILPSPTPVTLLFPLIYHLYSLSLISTRSTC